MKSEALKEQARRHEQKEEWLKAIDLYSRAADELARDDQPDLSLYNRLGDLEVRVGNIERAVEHYERAIDLYVEAELPNNAIAICRKVVRNLPTRHGIFLRMGQIRARQGFLTDARQNFLEYAERMQKSEDMEEAFRALIEFVELAPEDLEARTVLAAQLAAHQRVGEAVEQYWAIHRRLIQAGREAEAEAVEEKIRELDPDAESPPEPQESEAADDVALAGFETTALVEDFPVLESLPESPAPEAEEPEVDPGAFDIAVGGPEEEPESQAEAPVYEAIPGLEAGLDLGVESEAGADVGDPEAGWDTSQDGDLAATVEVDAGAEVSPDPEEAVEGQDDGPEAVAFDDLDAAARELASWAEEEETAALADDAGAVVDSAEADLAAAHTEAGDDVEEEDSEPLPLIGYDDDDEVLGAADFGVRDDSDRMDEYVQPSGDLPEIEVELPDAPLEAEADAEPAADEVAAGGAPETAEEDAPTLETPEPIEAEPGAEEGAPEPVGVAVESSAEEDLLSALQERVELNPEDPASWLALAQELFTRDRVEEASLALDQAIGGFEEQGDVDGAIRAVRTQMAQGPDALEPRQRLVELAIRKNDPQILTPAYLELADCLVQSGEGDRARAVYQQVLVTESDNARALQGLSDLDAAPSAPVQEVASSEDYVDLGSLILDGGDEKTTRWRVAAEEPSGDEEADFAKMLSQFKEKVAENLEADDLAAHYDLGTAYKEMGLVDEAISEFQQALRAEAAHLPTHELLGQCFIEKGQFEVAVRSMSRALDSASEVEDELLGIYYQMARAHEELGNTNDALEFYEKVFALDINFQDVTERLRGLR